MHLCRAMDNNIFLIFHILYSILHIPYPYYLCSNLTLTQITSISHLSAITLTKLWIGFLKVKCIEMHIFHIEYMEYLKWIEIVHNYCFHYGTESVCGWQLRLVTEYIISRVPVINQHHTETDHGNYFLTTAIF